MRKLLKYEMRAMNRRLFPVYIGMLAIAVLNYFFGFGTIFRGGNTLVDGLGQNMPQALYILIVTARSVITALFFFLLVGMMVVWLLTTINRFRKGLLGAEGYLMFTLPVTPAQLVGAKLLASTIHGLLSSVVALLSFLILLGIPEFFRMLADENVFALLRDVTRAMPTWPLLAIEMFIVAVLGMFDSILRFYLAMAIGQLSNRNRTLLSVASYIGISTAVSMLSSLLFSGLALFDEFGLSYALSQFFMDFPHLSAHLAVTFLLLLAAVQCAIFWFPTIYILKHKLNLE